jgi:hypothetical protein
MTIRTDSCCGMTTASVQQSLRQFDKDADHMLATVPYCYARLGRFFTLPDRTASVMKVPNNDQDSGGHHSAHGPKKFSICELLAALSLWEMSPHLDSGGVQEEVAKGRRGPRAHTLHLNSLSPAD